MTASERFEACQARVLRHEGGYSNHPRDPGGVTLEGVTQRVYDAYRRSKGRPLRRLTATLATDALWVEERDEIHRKQFWGKIRGDELPLGIDYVVYDGAVNSGPGQSVKWLQRALNDIRRSHGQPSIAVDGDLGAITLQAIEDVEDHDRIVNLVCDRRLAFMQTLQTWNDFRNGWTTRVSAVRRQGVAWARDRVELELPAYRLDGETENARATLASAPELPTAQNGTVTAAGGTVAATIAEVARQIEPLTGSSATLAQVFGMLTVAGVMVTCGGLAWNWFQEQRRRRLIDRLDLDQAAGAPT